MTSDNNFIGFGLHDAVLEQFVIDWLSGSIEICFSAVVPKNENVTITASGLTEFICPRQQPWGLGDHVVFVNDVRLRSISPDLSRLEVEMGSGDVITLIAQHFERFSSPRPIVPGDFNK